MKRQSMIAYGEPLQETSADTPSPQGTEVIVRISHCGVCHSDIHMHDGYFELGGGKQLDVREGRTLPFTLGHEIAGTVEAVGPDAEGVEAGEAYAVYPWIGCGSCDLCLRGDEHLCNVQHHLGINVDGGYSTHVVVPHPRYLLSMEGIDAKLAGSYMCSGLTAYSALKKAVAQVGAGPIMIVGVGGVGMMGLQFARALYDAPILAADIDPAKRETALKSGADQVFDPREDDIRKTVLKATGGAVAAVDFVGSEASLKFAQSIVRKGGTVVVSGLMGGTFSMPVPMFPLRALSIIGTFVGSLTEAREMLDLVRAGKVAPIPVELRPLDKANASLDDLRNGRVIGRVVLTP
jgi:D-arabinose 1-dehydrogenase-like Zn-dependent alcohol dehydrogenase